MGLGCRRTRFFRSVPKTSDRYASRRSVARRDRNDGIPFGWYRIPGITRAFVLTAVVLVVHVGAAHGQSTGVASSFRSVFLEWPVPIGQSVERAYDALHVPPELAEPCFVDRETMTAKCSLGLSHVYHPGRRILAPDALPFDADSIELTVLTEARLVIGYQLWLPISPAQATAPAVMALRKKLRVRWGAPTDSVAGCVFWSERGGHAQSRAFAPWSAVLCPDAQGQYISLGISTDATAARRYFAQIGNEMPDPISPSGADLQRWWTPLWHPFRLGAVEVGDDIAATAVAVSVPPSVERCHRDERPLIVYNALVLTCEWARPVISVAGQSASEMSVDVVIDSVRHTSRTTALRLTFGTQSMSKETAARDCLAIVDAVKPTWGEPLKSDRPDGVCNAEWASVPFRASVYMAFDDRKTGSDAWRVYLYLSVSPDAAPPSEWRK